MKSMILDWYYSVVLPELKADLDDEEYRKAEQERGKLLDALMDTLNKQQKEQLLASEEACNWADGLPDGVYVCPGLPSGRAPDDRGA